MKKIVTLALALSLAVAVKAEFVRSDVAARYAQSILGMSELPTPQNTGSLRVNSRDGSNVPDYYIFNNPDGGWAIIAADDRVNPVVGYSTEGSFPTNAIPDNVRWWMDGVSQTIDAAREQGVQASDAVNRAWRSPRRAPESGKVELETASWGQAEPYNDMCPIVTGENVRALTGCVATAMAIIMRYNEWPEHGNGVIGGYTTMGQTYITPYSIASHAYDWENLPLTNASSRFALWSSAQKTMIAQIMHDCGVSAKMNYSAESSGTSSWNMLNAMQENFSYSKSSELISRSSYNLDEWFRIIKNEIDNGRVVYYGADGDAGGHAFVCDGYDTDGSKLRLNWGWGGAFNGFFTLDLYVEDLEVSFPDYQEAIIGLAPDTVQIQLDSIKSLTCYSHKNFYGIEPVEPVDMVKGTAVDFMLGWFMNNSNEDFNAEFKIILEDKDGNLRQEGWYATIEFPAANGYIYSDVTEKTVLAVTPEISDHFRLYIKNGKGEWEPMYGNYDILPDVDGITCGVIRDPLILISGECAVGQEVDLSLSDGFTHIKSVKWSVNGTSLDKGKVKLVQGTNAIKADVEYLDNSTGSIYKTLQLE